MNKIFIFSQTNFLINNDGNCLLVNKNSPVKVENNNGNTVQIKNMYGEFNLNLKNPPASNQYRNWQINNDTYFEIITTSYNCLLEKFLTKSGEILVFNDAAKIIYNNKCYFYYYNFYNISTALEDEKNIYIFNQKNLLIFNKLNMTFNLLKVKNYQKNGKNIEILCKFPKNINFFIHFNFSLTNNKVTIKKLSMGNINNNIPLEYLIFYLCKNDFEEAKKYISNNLEFCTLCEYFKKYDDIVCIQNKYYLYNSCEITPVNFKTENNKIVDID